MTSPEVVANVHYFSLFHPSSRIPFPWPGSLAGLGCLAGRMA